MVNRRMTQVCALLVLGRPFSWLLIAMVVAFSSNALAAAPAVTLTASPNWVYSGGTSTLTWSSTGATSCSASGNWSGGKALSGTQITSAQTTDLVYKLTCTGSGGSTTVSAPIYIRPIVTLTASPTSVASGATTKLTWSSAHATSCTASGSWSGTRALSGTVTTSALTTNVVYQLTCTGAGGSTTALASVKVGTTKPAVILLASPNWVRAGGTSTLQWSSAGATSCTASGGWSGTKATSGTWRSGGLTANQSFTLTCSGAGGSIATTVAVTVQNAATATATLTLTANPTSVAANGSSTLSWGSTGVTSCTASGAWTGTRATSGTYSTGPLTSNKSYTLTCTGTGGTVAKTAAVAVSASSPKVTLSATPKSVARNGYSTLAWTGTNVTSCSASGGWSGTKPISGSQSVGPLTIDTNYSLTCSGPAGNALAMTSVVLREATLSWAAPTKNVDGSTVSLSGYKVYYGNVSRSYTQSVSVSGATTLKKTIVLTPGTWYFAVTAIDTHGVESGKSNEVSKFIP